MHFNTQPLSNIADKSRPNKIKHLTTYCCHQDLHVGCGVPEVRGALHLGRHCRQDVQCAEGLVSSGQLIASFMFMCCYLYTNLCVMNSIVNEINDKDFNPHPTLGTLHLSFRI